MRKRTVDFPIRMTAIVDPKAVGEAEVTHFTVSDADAKMTAVRAAFSRDRHGYVRAGTYARLSVSGQLVMTDTDMERVTNRAFLRNANGRVLIAGLGLGMIVHGALAKRDVKHVTVIEKSADVIALINPTLPDRPRKLAVIESDIFKWTPPRGTLFDTIYFDIWPERCGDNLAEMATLHRRFARYLNRDNPQRWMESWYRDQLKYERERDRRQWRF